MALRARTDEIDAPGPTPTDGVNAIHRCLGQSTVDARHAVDGDGDVHEGKLVVAGNEAAIEGLDGFRRLHFAPNIYTPSE